MIGLIANDSTVIHIQPLDYVYIAPLLLCQWQWKSEDVEDDYDDGEEEERVRKKGKRPDF